MPELDALAPELARRGVGMMALSVAPDDAAVQRAAVALHLTIPVALTGSEMLAPNDVRGVPSVLFVDAQGRVIAALNGRQRADTVRERALALVR